MPDGNNLTGSLPAELGKLQSLTRLALNRKSLSGAMPSESGSLSNLSVIGPASNSLSGKKQCLLEPPVPNQLFLPNPDYTHPKGTVLRYR